MKTRTSILILALSLTVALRLNAQSFSIDWFTVDSGGGTSAGGAFTVNGTIGQPDAGTMAGGTFGISGGFWSVSSSAAISGPPTLKISLTTTNTAIVSWPNPSLGFYLQQNTNVLTAAGWVPVTNTVFTSSTLKYVIIAPPTGMRSYRLQAP